MDVPWKQFVEPESDHEYLALLTYLPLKSFWSIPHFFWFTFQIQGQLRKSAGIIGYSLRAFPMRRTFWTLSVWQDDLSLMDFVDHIPHMKIMKTLAPRMGQTKFIRWRVRGSAIPPRWEEAIRRAQPGGQ